MGRRKGSKNKFNTQVELKCIVCKKIFLVRNYRKDDAKYCSRSCASKDTYKLRLSQGFTVKYRTPHNTETLKWCGQKTVHK